METEHIHLRTSRDSSTLLYGLVGVISFVAGFGVQFLMDASTPSATENIDTNDTFVAGYEAARQRLVDRGVIIDATEETIPVDKKILGVVEGVEGNSIIVRIPPLFDPLADDDVRTLTVTDSTQFFEARPRPFDNYQVPVSQDIASGSPIDLDDTAVVNPDIFDPYVRTPATIADVRVGSRVEITLNNPAGDVVVALDIVRDELE